MKLEGEGKGITRSKIEERVMERVKRIERLLEKEEKKRKRNLVFKGIKGGMDNTREDL